MNTTDPNPTHPTPAPGTPMTDEHGNPMPCMYRIKFPGDEESYFYTEKTYRTLETALATAQAEAAELRRERDLLTELSVAAMTIAEEPRELWDIPNGPSCPMIEEVKKLRNDRDQGFNEAKRLAQIIWRTEFQENSPDWKPLDSVAGIIGQIDNMYAGVRAQRDSLRAENARLKGEVGVIGECLAMMKNYQSGGVDASDIRDLVEEYVTAIATIPEGEYEGADGIQDVVRWLFVARDTALARIAELEAGATKDKSLLADAMGALGDMSEWFNYAYIRFTDERPTIKVTEFLAPILARYRALTGKERP